MEKEREFISFHTQLPPIGVEVEVEDIDGIKTDTLLKVEYINQEVVYTWTKKHWQYFKWRPLTKK